MIRRPCSLLPGFIVLFAFAGCITSRSPDCPDYHPERAAHLQQRSITCTIRRSTATSIGKEFKADSPDLTTHGGWARRQSQSETREQFQSVFAPVATTFTGPSDAADPGDITLTVHQQNTYNPLCLFPVFLSGLSGMTLPVWGEERYYLHATARDNRTQQIKTYLIQRKFTTFRQIYLLFAMPFSELPSTAVDCITLENWKELRARMEADGFFNPVTQASAMPGPAAPATPHTSGRPRSSNYEDKAANLKMLFDSGFLTQAEYDQALRALE